MEQNGGSIQRIFERQFEQNPCSPFSKNFSQQGHCGGRKNWNRVDWNPMIHSCLCLSTGRADIMVEWNRRKLQWEVSPFRRRRRQDACFLSFLDRISAPLMTLRAVGNPFSVGNPFFRFSFAGGAKEGKVRSPAQFESLSKFLGRTTKVFFVKINFSGKPVKGWTILHV